MKKSISNLILVVATTVIVSAQNVDKKPFCTTCTLNDINADVYIVLTDELVGKQIAEQFSIIHSMNGLEKNTEVGMSLEEFTEFLQSEGFYYIKEGGDVYFILKLENRYALIEIERVNISYTLKIQPYEKSIRQNLVPFLQVVIPRVQKIT